MDVASSFFTGILSAFTPCVIVLFPLTLLAFYYNQRLNLKSFTLFMTGFLATYSIFALALAQILSSTVQNGFKLGLAMLFIVVGYLGIRDRINPLNTPIFKNSFLTGSGFALIISSNPCTLPYLGLIISLSSTRQILLNIIAYSTGLLTPALFFAFFGEQFLDYVKSKTRIMHKITRYMNALLIVSGIYLAYTLKGLGYTDIYVASAMLALVYAVIIRSYFIFHTKKDLFSAKNILLITSMILILYLSITHCKSHLQKNTYESEDDVFMPGLKPISAEEQHTCSKSGVGTGCSECRHCLIVFTTASLLGLAGTSIIQKSKRRRKDE